MIKIGIIGGAGYTAGELIRLLLNHPDAEIVFVNSSSNAGNKITYVHTIRSNRSVILLYSSWRHKEIYGKPCDSG